MSDLNSKNNDFLEILVSAQIVQIILYPLLALKNDIGKIREDYKRLEHIVHLSLLVIALGFGSYAPFGIIKYGVWLNNVIISLLGLAGANIATTSSSMAAGNGIITFLTGLTSAWGFSTTSSAFTTWGTKLVRKIIYGDWDYYLTSAQCLTLVERFNNYGIYIDTTELNKIFTSCLKLYRAPPGLLGAHQIDFKIILDGILRGDPTAIRFYDDQQLAWKKLIHQYNRRHARAVALIQQCDSVSQAAIEPEPGDAVAIPITPPAGTEPEFGSDAIAIAMPPLSAIEPLARTEVIEPSSPAASANPSRLLMYKDVFMNRIQRNVDRQLSTERGNHERCKTSTEKLKQEMTRVLLKLQQTIDPRNIQPLETKNELIAQALEIRRQIIASGHSAGPKTEEEFLQALQQKSIKELRAIIRQVKASLESHDPVPSSETLHQRAFSV